MKINSKYKNTLLLIFVPTVILLISTFFYVYIQNNFLFNLSINSDHKRSTCTFQHIKRSFIIYFPEDFNKKTKAEKKDISLIVLLHGYGNNAEYLRSQSSFEKDALKRNYAVLYLNGIRDSNVSTSSNGWHYSNDKISKHDIRFIKKITKCIEKKYDLNNKNFYIGFSNGGFMTMNLAVKEPSFVTAIASIGGMMPETVWNNRKYYKNTIGFLQINGTKDEVVPMEFNLSNKNNPNPSMEKVIDYFLKVNAISSSFKQEQLSEKTYKLNYDNKVQWIIIKDGTHCWPTERWCGININNEILDFFDNF